MPCPASMHTLAIATESWALKLQMWKNTTQKVSASRQFKCISEHTEISTELTSILSNFYECFGVNLFPLAILEARRLLGWVGALCGTVIGRRKHDVCTSYHKRSLCG